MSRTQLIRWAGWALMTNYPLLIGAGVPGFVGYVGAPIWAVWFGWVLGSARPAGREIQPAIS